MASNSDPANPPVLDDGCNYESWKKDLAVWELYTGTENKKKGPRLYLCLKGKAREIVRELPLADISAENGLQKIKAKLDDHFEKDKVQRSFMNLENFEKFRRGVDMPIHEFISKFDQLHNKVKENNITYPDGVLAYKLLTQANLAEGERNLIKATMTDLTYENIKKALLSVFSDITKKTSIKSEPLVKVEETCYNEGSKLQEPMYVNRGRFRGRNQRGRMQQTRGRGYNNTYGSNTYNVSESRGRSMNQRGRGNTNNTRRLNPVDIETGEPSKCAICNSIYHWARNCPDAFENQNSNNTRYNNPYYLNEQQVESGEKCKERITLFCNEFKAQGIKIFNMDTMEPDKEKSILLKEALSTGVLDTGAPDNVSGRLWIEEYIKTLTADERKQITRTYSNKQYKFGDSKPMKATENIKLPMTIANEKVYMCTDVVEVNIPLLISKKAMQKVKATLDYGENKLHIFGKSIKLLESTSGHYLVPIHNHIESENHEINSICFVSEESDMESENNEINELYFINDKNNETYKKALKIHRHFSHARKERIKKILEDAGVWNQDYNQALSEIENQCKVCKVYTKPPMKPSVGFSYAKEFNEVISIDLKDFHHENKTYKLLHVVDQATRFSQAVQVKSKKKEEIMEALMSVWISVFGPPSKILSDNGGEFLNEDFIECCDKFCIKVKMTAAESPWGNGVCERHHKILCDTLEKTLEEVKNFKVALYWAVQAKNSLYNLHGFSPFILVFGRNPRLPNIIDGTLPSFENLTTSEYIAQNLNSMNTARQAFIKSESEEKIKRALRHNVSSSVDTKYFTGDRVYIKRRGDNRWSGPGTVLGQESQQILVRIGGFYYRVHPCRVILVEESEKQISKIMKDYIDKDNVETSSNNDENESEINAEHKYQENENNEYENNENENNENENNENENNENGSMESENNENENENNLNVSNENDNNINENNVNENENKIQKPKRNSSIEVVVDGIVRRGRVMKGQPKQSSIHKNWVNIEQENGEKICINFEKVENWKILDTEEEDTEEIYICAEREKEEIIEAKNKEINNWIKNEVFEEVKDVGQSKISVRWVIEEKIKDGHRKFKTRLVARGFEDVEETRNDSPTCAKESIRIMLVIGASKKWKCKSLDIRAAFLQGNMLEREVFLKPPSEFRKKGIIWRLKRCVYGLNQASRMWYLKVREEMIKLGAESPKVDPAYFIWKRDEKVIGILSSHVDDFMYCGEESFEENVIKKLKTIFEISSESENMFAYLGIKISSEPNYFTIDQLGYVTDKLKPIEVNKIRLNNKEDLINETERTAMRSVIGKLMWLVNQSRPDIACDTSIAASKVNTAKISDIIEVNKILKKVKANDVMIKIPSLRNLENSVLLIYADAAHGNLNEGGSQAGYVIFLVDEYSNCALISWGSHREKRVARSTLTAETLAMCDAVDRAAVINVVLSNLIFCDERRLRIICLTDSRSLYEAIRTSHTTREKRLLIDICALREASDRDEIEVQWIDTKRNLANSLTKKAANTSDLLRVLKSGKLELLLKSGSQKETPGNC